MTSGASAENDLVRVSGLTKRFGHIGVLHDVGFSIRGGEILGLIGPNGAGKTTLFECIAGLEPAQHGEVRLRGVPVEAGQRSTFLFYVPDAITPWPEQTVEWALQFALGFFGGRRQLLGRVIEDLRLEELLHTRVGVLSRGQRKRILIALGLLARQPVVLIDEPFEGLDLRQGREAAAALRNHSSEDRTFFVSIHQIADAARICDRFVLLSDGRVAAEGTLEELTTLAGRKSGRPAIAGFEEVFLALT